MGLECKIVYYSFPYTYLKEAYTSWQSDFIFKFFFKQSDLVLFGPFLVFPSVTSVRDNLLEKSFFIESAKLFEKFYYVKVLT